MANAEGGLSRRRIIQGAAWATPAILVATASPPAAASGRSLETTLITQRGASGWLRNVKTVTVTLPSGVGATGVAAAISWRSILPGVAVTAPGWSGPSTQGAWGTGGYRYTATLTRASLSAGASVTFTFSSGANLSGSGNDFTITLTGVNTSTGLSDSVSLIGDFAS